jgi:hypothetical protein
MAIKFPNGMTEEQATRWMDFIESEAQGQREGREVDRVPDNATLTALPISLADALFAEMTRLTMEQACAMYQVPLGDRSPARRPSPTTTSGTSRVCARAGASRR